MRVVPDAWTRKPLPIAEAQEAWVVGGQRVSSSVGNGGRVKRFESAPSPAPRLERGVHDDERCSTRRNDDPPGDEQ